MAKFYLRIVNCESDPWIFIVNSNSDLSEFSDLSKPNINIDLLVNDPTSTAGSLCF